MPMSAPNYIRWFDEIRLEDLPLVGAQNASLGELRTFLSTEAVSVPNGFALTAQAYRECLDRTDAWTILHQLLDGLDKEDAGELAKRAGAARQTVYDAAGWDGLRAHIADAYRGLEEEYGTGAAVAVRSSATAAELTSAGFACRHESFDNVRGEADVLEACRRCLASIFTDRAIVHRLDNGIDHFKAAVSVGVMKMVRSDLAASGAIFTLDTESGFPGVVFITATQCLDGGRTSTAGFWVHKLTFKEGYRAVFRRSLGAKQARTDSGRERFCLSDTEVLGLADCAIKIEDHYSKKAGHPLPMDIEWAKSGEDGRLYIVKARSGSVVYQRPHGMFETFTLKGTGPILAAGRAVGEKIASGAVRAVSGVHDLAAFRPGEVLVSHTTSPGWEQVMKTAAAIVTNRGGCSCHAAIVARELGIPAAVGAGNATEVLLPGATVTVCCAEGGIGRVYDGEIPFDMTRIDARTLARPRTAIMLNLGNPDLAFKTAMLPNEGVGLARMEFIISEHIGVHPMALAEPEKVTDAVERKTIARLVHRYARPADFFIEKLSEGIGTIAAAFFPKPVIVCLSDFKTSEYAKLIGGAPFEPKEENPMLGFRGASRYLHPSYAAGFALECAALRQVRDNMGLTNLRVMVPFCRRVEEGRRVIEAMAAHGLKRGENGLEIYLMCEIPNNVIEIDAFSKLFDGFSIGSNDLTQLTLGIDRDSEIADFDFDERDPGMLEMFRLAVTGGKRNGRRVGICGEAPANYPDIARFLTGLGIDFISVNPASLMRIMTVVREAEGGIAAGWR
jgi:pyruvate,water dikinase